MEGRQAVSLANSFINDNGSGNRCVQGVNLTVHREGYHKVTVLFGQTADTAAFGTDNNSDWSAHIGGTPWLTVHIGAENPKAFLLEFLNGGDDICYADNRHIFHSTGRGFRYGSPTPRRFGMITPCAPAASAVRMMAPRLCGSSMLSQIMINGG